MRLIVKSRQGSYPVRIEFGCFDKWLSKILIRHPQREVALITDENIYSLQKKQIYTLLKKNSQLHLLTIPAGEKYKNNKTKVSLEKQLFEMGFDRGSILVAWGGGVIGDLVGFLASTYLRGITYYALPSSVIAMVDSSIGGKTGIDTTYGKNLIGTIYPPKEVFIDLSLLKTLPEKEFINGCAEIAKYHFIARPDMGKLIYSFREAFHQNDIKTMIQVVCESLEVKAEVVGQDETEQGLRRILNFGHTFGHALEHLSHYRITHGFAVAIGMGVEAFWSFRRKGITLKEFDAIISMLTALKLPSALPQSYNSQEKFESLYRTCLHDKKSKNQTVYFVCLKGIGKVRSNRGEYREKITKADFMLSLRDYNRFWKERVQSMSQSFP